MKGATLIEAKEATVETEEISTSPREEAIETDRPIGLTTTNQATTQVRATDVELDLLINQQNNNQIARTIIRNMLVSNNLPQMLSRKTWSTLSSVAMIVF